MYLEELPFDWSYFCEAREAWVSKFHLDMSMSLRAMINCEAVLVDAVACYWHHVLSTDLHDIEKKLCATRHFVPTFG
jgi:hypothetical protein